MEDNLIDFCFITESWLKTQYNFVTSTLNEAGFQITHCVRSNKKGGGVAIISKQTFVSKYEKMLDYSTFECVIQSFRVENNPINLTIVVIYRPDSHSDNINTFLDEFYNLTEYVQLNFKHFIICGDLNIHVNKVHDQTTIKFNNILDTFTLSQSVQGPTHKLGNTLDLIIHDQDNVNVSNIHIDDVDRISDHFSIFFDINRDIQYTGKKHISYRNIKNVDRTNFCNDLKRNATSFMENSDSNNFYSSFELFNNLVTNTVNDHAPLTTKIIENDNRPPWMDNEFLDARRARRRAYKKWKRSKSDEHREDFVQLRRSVDLLSKQKRCDYYQNAIRSSKSQKELFKAVNNLLDRGKKPILPYSENPKQLADRFNDFFITKIEKIRTAMSMPQSTHCPNPVVHNSNVPKFSSFRSVTIEEVTKQVSSMKIKTCPRDPIPASLLKTSIDSLIPCYVELINLSLSTGSMDGLKESVVTPILKKSGLDPDTLSNYRPICGGLFIDKLIQTNVKIQLTDHMDKNHLHIKFQSGYKPHHSCETVLLMILNDILIALDSGLCSIELLLDLSAAFDTVDHDEMMVSLKQDIGVDGTVYKWFSSFLSNRSQRTSVSGSNSDSRDMPYGVPQGSVLGPILFNIYVRNFIELLESVGFKVHGYADDHQLFYKFRIEFQFHAIATLLPKALNIISQWMSSRFLKLNAGKSQLLIFTPKNIRENMCFDKVYIGDNMFIPVSLEAVNLGVKLDSQLTFTPHINMVVSQSYKQIYNIGQIRKYLTVEDLRTLVQSLLVSKLDNCNSLLFGVTEYEISRLQKVQNSCARLIYGKKKNEPVSALLSNLHWLHIKQRIYFKILLFIFKFFKNMTPVYINECLHITNHDTLTLNIPKSKTSYGDRAFENYAPRLWNSLPLYLKTKESTFSFKRHLKHYLFTYFHDYTANINRYIT